MKNFNYPSTFVERITVMQNPVSCWPLSQFLILLIVFYSNTDYAQYGITRPGFNGVQILSSAKQTNVNLSGFLTSGYDAGASGTNPDFVIHQVDDYAMSFTPTATWGNEYEILDDLGCGAPARVYNCKGIYAIEATNPGSGEAYAITGVYDGGVFFATLNATGNVIMTYRWLWPGGQNQNILPPMITAASTAGDYYICGTVAYRSYAMKINAIGTPAWQKSYGNVNNEARAIMESPYNNNEVIVVGKYDANGYNGSSLASLLTLDAGSGVPLNLNIYGFNNGTHADHWFNSIAPANSTTGGSNGYIVGGRAYDPLGAGNHNYKTWMMKLDQAGNSIWSSLIEPYNAGSPDAVQDVFERYNPSGEFYDYEYYGVSVGDGGSAGTKDTLVVWRLDDNGDKTGVFPNEMKYEIGDGMGGAEFASQIECVGDGTNSGDGFGAWTTDLVTYEHVFTKNYFNGVNGCNEFLNPINVHQGPGLITNFIPTDYYFGQACQVFSIAVNSSTVLNNCWNLTVANGGNLIATEDEYLKNNVTGVIKNNIEKSQTSVFPNPASSHVIFSFTNSSTNNSVSIQIKNTLGQIVHEFVSKPKETGMHEELIDLQVLNLESGTYFITADINGSQENHKLIYIK